jgi:hypothetical protein
MMKESAAARWLQPTHFFSIQELRRLADAADAI